MTLLLVGYYYDGGGYMKFGLPMAFTVTMLSWGMILFPDGYIKAGEYQNGLDAIKWGTDYFLECHTGKTSLYHLEFRLFLKVVFFR